ncbi:hypothetical protein ABEB36_008882 [Hypothenemus hampei]|uniref:Uncharacterized protein n=1 Tax=Hypothenemus hampei TaxID=57062 RepID=A0ABD1ENE2_HYPHA
MTSNLNNLLILNGMLQFSRPHRVHISPLEGICNPIGNFNCRSSSTVIGITSKTDGRQEECKATPNTKVAPGDVKETPRTRAHIEKEQNSHNGDREELQDSINLDENNADEFNKVRGTKIRCVSELPRITSQPTKSPVYDGYPVIPEITAKYRLSESNYDDSGREETSPSNLTDPPSSENDD